MFKPLLKSTAGILAVFCINTTSAFAQQDTTRIIVPFRPAVP